MSPEAYWRSILEIGNHCAIHGSSRRRVDRGAVGIHCLFCRVFPGKDPLAFECRPGQLIALRAGGSEQAGR